MATTQLQLTVRKPLRPKNTSASPISSNIEQVKPKPEPKQRNKIYVVDDSNKENLNPKMHSIHHPISTPVKVEALEIDSSLGEELNAIRKKLERLRLDKDKTEKMLKERDDLLNFQMEEFHERGQTQRLLEIEVDRLFRLKELKSYCMRISPIKSLRVRQHEDKRISGGKSLDIKAAESEEESMDGKTLLSPATSDNSEAIREIEG